MSKVVTFKKNKSIVEADITNSVKVKQLEADGWKATSERVMRKGDQVVTVNNEVQQAAYEKFGFVFEKFQSPKL